MFIKYLKELELSPPVDREQNSNSFSEFVQEIIEKIFLYADNGKDF